MAQKVLCPAVSLRQRAAEGQEPETVQDQLIALMDRYEEPIYAYLVSMARDRDLALDFTQDTFLRAYDGLRGGRTITGSWLYTVAHNLAVDEFRRRKRVTPDGEVLTDLPSREPAIESSLDVQAVMDRLPPLDREVLYLFEVAGFKTHEIGAMLGMRGGAVRQRLVRARERFRALYQSSDGERWVPTVEEPSLSQP